MTDPPALVPDTHVFLHGRNFNEIKWQQLLPDACLAMVMPVIDELDAWKGKRADSQLAGRARDVGRQINEALGSGYTAGGIPVEIIPELAPAEVAAMGFDPDSKDHRLMADVTAFRKATGRDVRIVTTDNGMQIRCKGRGVPFIRFPSALLLDVRDDRDAKITNLEGEVKRLRKPLPALTIVPSTESNGEGPIPLWSLAPLPDGQDPRARANALVEKEQHDLVHFRPQFLTYAPGDIARVQKELTALEPKLVAHFKAEAEAQGLLSRTFPVEVDLKNDGGAPAEDVDIMLGLPEGFIFVDEGGVPVEPQPVAIPRASPILPPAFGGHMKILDHLRPFEMPNYFAGLGPTIKALEPPANATGPEINKQQPEVARFHVQNLKHGSIHALPTVYIRAPLQHPPAVSVDYRIAASNDPDIRTGNVVFKLNPGSSVQWRQIETDEGA